MALKESSWLTKLRPTISLRARERVILATDGDFNIGVTNQGDLIRFDRNEGEDRRVPQRPRRRHR